jgi:alanine racemase
MLQNLLPIAKIYTQLIHKQLVTDSRQVINPSQTVFFAISGKNHNGHHYISNLHERGVRNFVIEPEFTHTEIFQKLNDDNTNFILAENSLTALQLLASFHRRQFKLPIIAVTGSNGKTIIKEWLGQLLETRYQVCKSPKSYNSQIGVPLSVWQLTEKQDIAVFEAGISQVNEMQKLQSIIRPTVGVFTNIGTAHDEGFANRQEKIREKLQLFAETQILIYCSDHQAIEDEISEWLPKHKDVTPFTWGFSPLADLRIIGEISDNKGKQISLEFKNQEFSLAIPFTDNAFAENCLHCVAVLLCLGFEVTEIEKLVQSLKPVQMRLELKNGINNCLLIDDTYNNDLAGLTVALNFMEQHRQKNKNTVIISDMLESGLSHEELYLKIAYLLENQEIDKVIGIGKQISLYADDFTQTEKYFFQTTQQFIEAISNSKSATLPAFNSENILIKGARSFNFEQIVNALQAKVHGTRLEINLEALTHNLNFYRSLLPSHSKIMVMVKAFAYGSGSFEVARLLQYQKIDYLAVAYTDEGIALRQNGITLPIMVMNPSVDSWEKLLQYNLEPEIYSKNLLLSLLNSTSFAALQTEKNKILSLHIKLDTGMHRLGFEEEDMAFLCSFLTQHKEIIKVNSIFTHLSGADSSEFDNFSHQQMQKFTKMADLIEQQLNYKTIRHVCNSPAIVRFQDVLNGTEKVAGVSTRVADMVRLGIGLYGVEANGWLQEKLRPIGTLKTVISQIKHIKAGETVGYSRKGKAETAKKIATIAIGYADGFNRKLSNGNGKVLINGQLAPIIGNVCMDMTMIDITDIEANEGDEVIIFGENPTVFDLAQQVGTIPYEILTSVGERVKRVFLSE